MSAADRIIPSIPAIETVYRGYRFRSRLEARWAVLFDAIGIKYQYEPEGYKLPSGEWYLPDFFLPDVRMWAEVKPTEFTIPERNRCVQLADGTKHPCLLLEGPPDFRTYNAVHAADIEGICTREEYDYLLDIDYHLKRYYEREHRFYACPGEPFTSELEFTPQYRFAVHTSRSYRFEGGH